MQGNPIVLVNQHDRCSIFCKISHSNPRQSWIRGLQIPCLWNLDSGIPRAEFQIPMQILGSTGEKVLGFWNSKLLSIGWWNYLGGIIRPYYFFSAVLIVFVW